jgi:hypothetical protein
VNRQQRREIIRQGKCPDNYHPYDERLTGEGTDLMARVVVNHTGDAKFPNGFIEILFASRFSLFENVGEWEPSWHNRIRVAVADVAHLSMAGKPFDEDPAESHATFADGIRVPFEYGAKLTSIREIIAPLCERDACFVFTFRSSERAWSNTAELSSVEHDQPIH